MGTNSHFSLKVEGGIGLLSHDPHTFRLLYATSVALPPLPVSGVVGARYRPGNPFPTPVEDVTLPFDDPETGLA